MFEHYRAAFDAGFGSPCGAIGPAERIASAVLAHDPLAVALFVLMTESLVVSHYNEVIGPDRTIDPLFRSVAGAHSREESQHAQVDRLIVETLAAGRESAAKARAVDDFFAIAAMLDDGLARQTHYDMTAFECATGRTLTEPERETWRRVQHTALRRTFLWSGMRQPDFVDALELIGEEARNRITEAAPALG